MAALEALAPFSDPWNTVRAIDSRLAQFKSFARLEVPFNHLADFGKVKCDRALIGSNGPGPLQRLKEKPTLLEKIVWFDLRKYLPPYLNALRIKNDRCSFLYEEDTMGFLQTLIDLVCGYDGVRPEDTQLKHICLAKYPSFFDDEGPLAEFLTLSNICEERKIDIHRSHHGM